MTNKPPQRYFAVMQFCFLLSTLVFVLYVLFRLLSDFSFPLSVSELTPTAVQLILTELFRSISLKVMIIFAIAFAINVLMGLIFYNRVGGPLVRVRNVLNMIAKGELPQGPIRFRKGDLTTEFAPVLNEMIGSLRHGYAGFPKDKS